MKKIIVVSALFLFSFTAKSQIFVNGVNINEMNVQYCMLYCTGDAFNNPAVYVDYGQPNQTKIDFYITDASSSRKPINSDVDALNYMYRNAWELVSSRQSIQLSTSNRSYYFQKKGK